jgi:hypothetical protein
MKPSEDTTVYIIHNMTFAIWRKCELITQVIEFEFWMIIEFSWLRFLEFQLAPTPLKLQNHLHRTSSFSTFQQYQKCASISLKFLALSWLNFQWKNCSILFNSSYSVLVQTLWTFLNIVKLPWCTSTQKGFPTTKSTMGAFWFGFNVTKKKQNAFLR